jgi:hypothetical protein
MFNSAQIEELAERKRLLAAESEINRAALLAEVSQFRSHFGKAESVVRSGWAASPILMAVAPIAGFFLSSKIGKAGSLLSKAFAAWRIFRSLKPLFLREKN